MLIAPAHQTVAIAPGGRVPVHVKLDRTGSLSGAILVTGSAGPSGLNAEPLVLTAEESEGDLHFQASEATEVGARGRVLVLAQSGREAYSATVDVEVIAPVSVEIQTASVRMFQTQSAQVKVAIKRAGGFTGPVRLAVQGPPPGISVDTQELTLEGGTTSATFWFRTNYLTPVANNPLTFTATVGRFSASSTTFLEVTRATTSSWDNSFGLGGWLTLPENHELSSLVIQPDGRLVVGAGTYNSNLWIHRLELDGSPDTTFGQEGVVELTSPVGATHHEPPRLLLQPDGKLLVLIASSEDVFLYRLNPNGALDTTFGSGGRATVDFDNYIYEAGWVLLPGGNILLAARHYSSVKLLRLSSQGQRDESYGVSGMASLPASDMRVDSALGFFIDAQGRALLATGYRGSDGSGGVRVFRVTREGVADTAFGPDGQRTYPVAPEFNPQDFSQLGAGFVTLGRVTKDYSTPGEQWIVRFEEQSGTLEYLWRSEPFPASHMLGTLTTLSDGRIMASVSTGLVRLLPSGLVDTSFKGEYLYARHLFTGQSDAVYFTSTRKARRLLPPGPR